MSNNWTSREEERQDCVDNAIHNLFEELAGEEIEWDIENISDVRDAIEGVIVDRLNLMTSYDFYPYRLLEPHPEINQEGFIISDQYGKLTHIIEDSVWGLDAQEFGDLVGEIFGGTCRYKGEYKYLFIPNSDYQGGLDDIKED
jgi:hypothetical protein